MGKVGKIIRTTLLDGIKDGLQNHQSLFLLGYSALSSSQMDNLRKKLRRVGAQMNVPRNRIAKLAFKELHHEKLADQITGQTAFVWSSADAVVISKTLVKFSEEHQNVVIKGGLLDGVFLEKPDVKRLSDLPAKEVLQARLLQVILSPLTSLAGALNAKTRDLLSILKQLSEKKGGN
jgi:large subunit ribosomal protein L10